MFTWEAKWTHTSWNFISVKMTTVKSIPALSFKRTCALNATSNESSLHLFISFRVNYVHMKISCRFEISFRSNWRYEIHTVLSFISPQFMWTQVKSWLNGASEIFSRNEISYRFEFISPLMWTYSKSMCFHFFLYCTSWHFIKKFFTTHVSFCFYVM